MASTLVNQGLTAVAEISKSIKDGKISSVPSIYRRAALSIGNEALAKSAASLEQGANAILQEVGINPNLLQQFGIAPGPIISGALDVASGVFNDVINGNFSTDDIIDAITNPLDTLSDLLGNTNNEVTVNGDDIRVSPYATDKSSIDNHPKFKFLFVAEIIFNTDFQGDLSENGNNMAFVVRTASRPNVNIEYEDVNMYNFKTKLAKSTEYQPITMSFYDDQSNQTTSFYKKYLELMIPNMQVSETESVLSEVSGMNFSNAKDNSNYSSASLGALSGKSGHKNIIKSIRLFHIWGWGKYVNVYKFINPKISQVNISDLDMDSTELSDIEIEFSYDGLNIETNTADNKNISVDPNSADNGGYHIPNYSSPGGRAKYPISYNGNSSNEQSPNGNNSNLSQELGGKSLDVLEDFTNPDAPDSDFLLTEKEPGFFEDFSEFLNDAQSSASNIINSTLSSARATLGDILPNTNQISEIYSDFTNSAAGKVLESSTSALIDFADKNGKQIANIISTSSNIPITISKIVKSQNLFK